MLADIKNRVLDVIDRLYGVTGQVSRPNQLYVGPPQLVHDVSRQVEAAQGFQTVIPHTLDSVGGAATVYASTLRSVILATNYVVSELERRNLNAQDVDVWWNGCSAVVTAATAANLGTLHAGFNFGTISGTGVSRHMKVFNTSVGQLVNTGAESVGGSAASADGNIGQAPVPHMLPDDDTTAILSRLTSGAGGQLVGTIYHWLWICPKGSFPPGS